MDAQIYWPKLMLGELIRLWHMQCRAQAFSK
eukprot:SAG31_NODE_24432_length_481_cov_1.007853_1_plen_30_part_10